MKPILDPTWRYEIANEIADLIAELSGGATQCDNDEKWIARN